jgi:hypothetical protein
MHYERQLEFYSRHAGLNIFRCRTPERQFLHKQYRTGHGDTALGEIGSLHVLCDNVGSAFLREHRPYTGLCELLQHADRKQGVLWYTNEAHIVHDARQTGRRAGNAHAGSCTAKARSAMDRRMTMNHCAGLVRSNIVARQTKRCER